MNIPRKWLTSAATAILVVSSGLAAFAVGNPLPMLQTASEEEPTEAPSDEATEEPSDEVTEEPTETTTETTTETPEAPTDDESPEAEQLGDEGLALDEEGDAGTEDDFRNHGHEVSTFAHETDLTGCERGHAISAVARGLDPETEAKPCNDDGEEDQDASLSGVEDEDETEDPEEVEDEPEVDGDADDPDDSDDAEDEAEELEDAEEGDEVEEGDDASVASTSSTSPGSNGKGHDKQPKGKKNR